MESFAMDLSKTLSATSQTTNTPKDKEPPHLLRLPREIRDKIWSELFARQAGVLPSHVYVRIPSHRKTVKLYKYQWDEKRTRNTWGRNAPFLRNISAQPVQSTFITSPTDPQAALFAAGVTKLPETNNKDGRVIHHYIYPREVWGIQVVNQELSVLEGFLGIRALSTCRQVMEEGTEVLYERNLFCFDTSGSWPYSNCLGVHQYWELDGQSPYYIPGVLNKDGNPSSPRQLRVSVNRLFDRMYQQRTFVQKDPLLWFIHNIGRHNASKLKNVKIHGIFKAVNGHLFLPDRQAPIGLARLCPIFTAVLNSVCPNLRSLTLSTRSLGSLNDEYLDRYGWDDDHQKKSRKEDAERISNTVAAVVQGLPMLKKLELGYYFDTDYHQIQRVLQTRDEWQGALH